MKLKWMFLFIITLFSTSFIYANHKAELFAEPTIVQNYPVNNMMDMNGAAYSYIAINELIDSAQKNINIEMFYINNEKKDSKLDKHIIEPLIQKAKSGVNIRILVDAGMAKVYPDEIKKLNLIKNIEVKKTAYFDQNGILHAKMIIVDDQTFYLGSHNFDWVTFELNHELGVIYKNKKLAQTLKSAFDFDWKNSEIKSPGPILPNNKFDNKVVDDYLITISPADVKDVSSDKIQFLKLINDANTSIDMQAMVINGYDIYNHNAKWDEFINAIENAALRGVKVRLMFSDWEFTNTQMETANKFLQEIIKADIKKNIEIRYSSFPLAIPCVPFSEVDHAKYAIFDGKITWITTANLTENYFNGCRNYSFTSYSNNKLSDKMTEIYNTMWGSKYMSKYDKPVSKITDITCSTKEK